MKMAAAHVPDDTLDALDAIAARKGVERTKVIRWAINEYIQRESQCPQKSTIEPVEEQEPVAA